MNILKWLTNSIFIIDNSKMHVIDSYLNDQSEMSAEDILDQYIENDNNFGLSENIMGSKSMSELLGNCSDDTKSVKVYNNSCLDNDFMFLGSKMIDYNKQIQNKLKHSPTEWNVGPKNGFWDLNKPQKYVYFLKF